MNRALRQAAHYGQERLKKTYGRYERFIPAFSFVAGVIWDMLSLGRMDQLINIVQLSAYLVIILPFLVLEARDTHAAIEPPKWLAPVWKYREEVVHFLFGSLLSAFAIFYFKSSSLIGSAVLFAVVCMLLVANEFSAFKQLGLSMRTALFALCATSYLICVMPIAFGTFGLWPFLTAILTSGGLLLLLTLVLFKVVTDQRLIVKHVVWPYAAILGVFVVLYFGRLIPPVPLSLTHVGVYHSVERADGRYRVGYAKNPWKFWREGEDVYWARAGDKLYCFFSIFSPVGFKDNVKVRWIYDDPKRGWTASDAVPVSIAGGRKEGYRGFAFKSNFQPGDWQIRIETSDDREIGRLYVTVRADQETDRREFTYESL